MFFLEQEKWVIVSPIKTYLLFISWQTGLFYLGVSSMLSFCFGSVDMIAERIDSGIQQTVNPVRSTLVEQLSNKAHNVRESLGIWNRPFSPLSSGHPNPVAAPNTNVQSQNEGNCLIIE